MPTAEVQTVTNDKGEALTDEQIAQEVERAEAEELASFDAYVSGKDLDEPDSDHPREPEQTVQTEPEQKQEPVASEKPNEEPKFAQITEEQLARLLTYSDDIEAIRTGMEQRFGSAFGRIGSISQTLKDLQSGGQAGEPVVVTDEDLAELKSDYPDLTPALAKGITRVMAKVKGGGRVVAQNVDLEAEDFKMAVAKQAEDAAMKIVAKEQLRDLADEYPDWEKIIGPTGSKTEFRTWLANEPAEYQKKVNTSQRAIVVAKALNRFYEHQINEINRQSASPKEKKKSAAQLRREQLQDSVNEKGTSLQQSAQSEEDAFNAYMSKANLS